MVLAVSCSRGADVGHERARLLVVYFGTAISPGRPAALDPAPPAFTALGALRTVVSYAEDDGGDEEQEQWT